MTNEQKSGGGYWVSLALSILILGVAVASLHWFGDLSYWLLIACGAVVMVVAELYRQRGQWVESMSFGKRVAIAVVLLVVLPLLALLAAALVKQTIRGY